MSRISKLASCIAGLTLFFTAVLPTQALVPLEIPLEIVFPIITNPIYVDKGTGDDTDTGQTPGEALKTITEAVDRANTGGESAYQILISEGDYNVNESFPWNLQKDISFFGGYYNNFNDRDFYNHPTEIKGSNAYDDLIFIDDKTSTISGLRFYGQVGGSSTIMITNSGSDNDSVSISGVVVSDSEGLSGVINATTEPGDNLTIKGNYFHDHQSLGATIIVEGDPNSAKISDNFLYNNSGGFSGGISAENALVFNNIISNIEYGAGLYLKDNAKAYNNTIVGCPTGIKVPSSSSNVEFMNNLVAYNSGAGADIDSTSVTYDYNAYFDNGTAHTVASHEVNCDPNLDNINSTNTSDYMLSSSSTCIDTGTEIADVTVDYFGNDRKLDGNGDAVYASDPGAHEANGDAAAAPNITNASANPNSFSPDGDGTNDTSTITFDLNVTSNVIVTIYDGTDVINQLVNEIRNSGTHNVVWDGTNTGGDPMPEAEYTYKISAQNSEGTDEYTGNVTIDMGAASTYCSGYPDVAFDDPLCPAITYVTDQGIFEGYPDGTFRSNDVINRVETTKVILEGFSIPLLPDDGTTLGFSDVIIGEWYMTYLRTGKDEGIIQGYPDGTFRPNQQVNRVEMLKIFFETSDVDLSGVTITEAPYPDTPIETGTSWYLPYVQFSKDNALVDPDASGNFNPAEGMMRGDVAKLFYRFHQEGFI